MATSKEGAPKRKSRTEKAGVLFPVPYIERMLHRGGYSDRLGKDAPVYLAAVLEYMTAEILDISGIASKKRKKNRIFPRDIMIAIRNDEELSKLWKDVIIPQAGVLSNVHSFLQPKDNQ